MRDILSDLEAGTVDPDPVRRAQQAMRTPLPRRFYERADAAEDGETGNFSVSLDGKPALTPGRRLLALPTRAAAELVAAEFAAQKETIDPVTMPTLRLANTAIDGVADDPQAVLEDIVRFASSDLLFYRAETPDALVHRQAEAWDPVLDWARSAHGVRFILAEGVMHVAQPRESLAVIGAHLNRRPDAFRLAALHVMTSLMGSALLALAVEAGELSPDDAWSAAHVDEDWNIAQWGEDAEAKARRASRWLEMKAAASLVAALGD